MFDTSKVVTDIRCLGSHRGQSYAKMCWILQHQAAYLTQLSQYIHGDEARSRAEDWGLADRIPCPSKMKHICRLLCRYIHRYYMWILYIYTYYIIIIINIYHIY
jgi:hypothetical protein